MTGRARPPIGWHHPLWGRPREQGATPDWRERALLELCGHPWDRRLESGRHPLCEPSEAMYLSRATLLPFLFVIICPIASGAFVLQMFGGCAREDSFESMTSINMLVFNKQVLATYSDKLNKFVPCSAAEGCIPQVQQAITQVTNYLNKDGNTSLRMEAKIQACYSNVKRFWRDTAQKTSIPTVRIAPIEPVNEGDPAVLVCYVSDFYPDPIGITWLKNGVPMGPNMTTSIVRSNGNWSYQAQVYLELIPGPGPADEARPHTAAEDQNQPLGGGPGPGPHLPPVWTHRLEEVPCCWV
ncbi:class II histocompatibility antigen, M beta 1 chain isoform X2 [Ambystoma mexicanum]|uniref:class II histocompatibility antigen, M beta 1 chain isoform X2 n=1 Tax=Ambystoma mexicanum TaxID=8296 RepID=UPI0037E92FBD